MFAQEPPRTPYDLQFRLGDVPVRVHPMFWLMCLFLGIGPSGGKLELAAIWVAAVFVSILVHELGHALTSRAFGAHPSITLYAFGGLASYVARGMSRGQRMAVTLAGPMAGFALAGALVLALFALDIGVVVRGGFVSPARPLDSLYLDYLVRSLLYINIWWGLINLLPIQPLDGGRLMQEALTALRPRGLFESYVVSVAVAGAVALYGALQQDWFLALFFGYLAFSSYQVAQALQSYGDDPRSRW